MHLQKELMLIAAGYHGYINLLYYDADIAACFAGGTKYMRSTHPGMYPANAPTNAGMLTKVEAK